MRILYLEETPIIEIQEPREGEDMLVDLGNMQFCYTGDALYQRQDGPSNKEITAMKAEADKAQTDDEKEQAVKDMIKSIREQSKKVLYKVITPNGLLIDKLKELTEGKLVEKEYLD